MFLFKSIVVDVVKVVVDVDKADVDVDTNEDNNNAGVVVDVLNFSKFS